TELLVATHGTEAIGVLLESCGHADTCPAADTRKYADVLLALVLIGKYVADDAGRRLKLEQLLVDVVGIDALEIAFQRTVAGDTTGRHERSAPDRKLLSLGLDDLAAARVPHDQIAHVGTAGRGKHRKRRAHIRLTRRVIDLEGLVVHAHM